MQTTLQINALASTCAALDLITIANTRLVISHLAINRYFKSSNPFGIICRSTDMFFHWGIVNGHIRVKISVFEGIQSLVSLAYVTCFHKDTYFS